jgi:hypothetical protein
MFTALLSLAVFGAMPLLSDDPPRPSDLPGDRPPPAQGPFERFDKNGDGVLDRDEFQQAMKQARQRRDAGPRQNDDGPPARPDGPRQPPRLKQDEAAEPRQCPSLPEQRPAPRRDGSCGRGETPMYPEARGMGPRRPDGPMGFGRDDGPERGRGVDQAVRHSLKRHRGEINRMIGKVVRDAMRQLHDGRPDGPPAMTPDRQGPFGPRGERPGPASERPRQERRVDRQMKRFDTNGDGCISRDEFRDCPGPRDRREAGRGGRPERRGLSTSPRADGRHHQPNDPPPDPDDMDD